jgi:hypothetical protein
MLSKQETTKNRQEHSIESIRITNLPELGSDLVSALTSLNVNDFAHDICLFQKAYKTVSVCGLLRLLFLKKVISR